MSFLTHLLASDGLGQAAKAVSTVAGTFATNKDGQAQRDADYSQAVLGQYAGEFYARANRTWFDSLVDGINRLIRPVVTLTLLAAMPAAFLWPQSVDLAFAALASLPDAYWAVLSLVLAFYFGGRMQLKGQDFRQREMATKAVAEARQSLRPQAETPPRHDQVGSFGTYEEFFNAEIKPIAPSFDARELLFMGAGNNSGNCKGKNAAPPRSLWKNSVHLARVLQAIRDRAGAPVQIMSCYRSPEYNTCVGGAKNSIHKQFQAADIVVRDGKKATHWHKIAKTIRDEGLFKGGLGLYGCRILYRPADRSELRPC